jgi:hypothetical protein
MIRVQFPYKVEEERDSNEDPNEVGFIEKPDRSKRVHNEPGVDRNTAAEQIGDGLSKNKKSRETASR